MGILSEIYRCVRHIKTEEGYRKVSEWQLAKDVECADGQDVDSKIDSVAVTLDNKINSVAGNADSRINSVMQSLGTQVTMTVSGTTLTIKTK